MIGQGLGLQDIPSVQHVKNVEVYLCMKYAENPHEVYSIFGDWFAPLLFGL